MSTTAIAHFMKVWKGEGAVLPTSLGAISTSHMRILYIEDEPADAQLVERYVKLTPHQLVLVNNIDDAQAALAIPPDLILVDVLLAGSRSGFTFVKELRRQGYAQPSLH